MQSILGAAFSANFGLQIITLLQLMRCNEEFSSHRTFLRVGRIRCDPGALATNKRGSKEPPCAFCTWLRPLPPREPQFYPAAFKGQCVEHFTEVAPLARPSQGITHSSHRDHVSHLQDPREIPRAAIEGDSNSNIFCQCDHLPANVHQSQT